MPGGRRRCSRPSSGSTRGGTTACRPSPRTPPIRFPIPRPTSRPRAAELPHDLAEVARLDSRFLEEPHALRYRRAVEARVAKDAARHAKVLRHQRVVVELEGPARARQVVELAALRRGPDLLLREPGEHQRPSSAPLLHLFPAL